MGAAVAAVNVVTGVLQVAAWRRKASYIRISLRLVEYRVLQNMARYCSLQSIWTIGMLFITGFDVTIVGHYDYAQTAYYSIATLPTSFVLLIISSVLNPLMPASSAMSTQRSAAEMGDFLIRTTRYSTVILLLTGSPSDCLRLSNSQSLGGSGICAAHADISQDSCFRKRDS